MPGIPREHIEDVWDLAVPMLQKAMDRMPGVYCMRELKSKCMDGTYVLWFSQKAKCALIIKVSQYHSYKACAIVMVGGNDLENWIDELSEIEQYAKSQGCKEMVVSGRRGWERILKDYKFDSVTVVKEL